MRGNNNSNGGTLRITNGNLSEDSRNSSTGGPEGARERVHGNRAGRGKRRRSRNDEKNRHGRCDYCRNSTEHGCHDCPLRHSHQEKDDAYDVNVVHSSVPNGNVFPMRGAPTFRPLIEHPIERLLFGCMLTTARVVDKLTTTCRCKKDLR